MFFLRTVLSIKTNILKPMFSIYCSTSTAKEHKLLERDCVIHVKQGNLIVSSNGISYCLNSKNVGLFTRSVIFTKYCPSDNVKYEVLEFDRFEVEKEISKNLLKGSRFVLKEGTRIEHNLNRLCKNHTSLKEYLRKSLITEIIEEIYDSSRLTVRFLKEDNAMHNLVKFEKEYRFTKKYEESNFLKLSTSDIKRKLSMPESIYQTKMKCFYVQEMEENSYCAKKACKEMNLGYSSYYRHNQKLNSYCKSDKELEENVREINYQE